ncbi:TMV resistance protein N-like [Cynara cardunculus var. scolymus]|uniref:TMV resistance protein N-like n=1 Tax=Cynara cardunculus var. scolymus TaxID=59895 RepID=UPI000D631060|nr:TMV resistance protein N-like [Cynara cardunculus var. scolymus]
MASSSPSSIHKITFKYDVFLSFRGEDTRTNFVDHLYDALKRQNIETYKDDKNLQKGKRIGKELFEAIEDSRFHVIVFSKNYASSSWCLDELVKIMECQKMMTEQTVYPIFYHVEPTEVRQQSGEFGKAFAKHEKAEATQKWRDALVEATSFSGWDLMTIANGHEVEFIKLVVKDISLKLPMIGTIDESLVGMRTRINGVVSLLNDFPDEFCVIGIWGMGGSGKTTLARAVFDQISFQFEGISFVANVREVSKPDFSGLNRLQQQVLRDVSNDQGITINNVFDGKTMMKMKMPGRKVLVVLDDVDHIDQLKALAGEPNWFKLGSRIIITTRDKQVLVAHKVANSSIHDVNLLTDEEAICLLSRCALGTESPSPRYEELSRQVVRYAAGLPLTITILGSSLCDANEDVWIDTLERLQKIPLNETLQKLELSYMGLDNDCKEIFLDVACILKGWNKNEATRALESRGFHAIHGLRVLEKKSLITISRYGCLDMHDRIEEMGRYIVRRSNINEPERHTRLWIEEEIKDILVNDLGTEATTCLQMIAPEINPETVMKGLGKMVKLTLLHMYTNFCYSDWEVDEVGQYFSNYLQYVKWLRYPFCSLPKTFQASNLVALDMCHGRMEQLWEGGERKVLQKLRFLELRHSKLRTFDLGLTPNLEILDLGSCFHLVELHMPAAGCPKLKSLKLGGSKLSTLDLRLVPNMETLNLNRCWDLVELDMPCECPQLKSLTMSGTRLRSLNLGLTPNIETLDLARCDGLVKLDMPRECLQLKSLNLSCPDLRSFNLGPTPNIETLKLEECPYLLELDISLECPQLESLDLTISMLRTLDLGLTPNLNALKLQRCYNLVELHMHNECCKLQTLSLECQQLRIFDFGLTLNLEALTLISFGCPRFEYPRHIHSKLKTLELTLNLKKLILEDCGLVELRIPCGNAKLKSIYMDGCSELKALELTPNLKKVILKDCGLVELHIPDRNVKLKSLDIRRCSELKTLDLGRTPNLKTLCLKDCSSLVKLHAPVGGLKELVKLKAHLTAESVDICQLHPNHNFPKSQFECSYKEDLPSSIGNIEDLILEGLSCACTDLQSFFGSICGLQHLTKLSLGGGIPDVCMDLDRLQCLEELTLKSTKIKNLPDSICMLKHLKILKIKYCKLLENLPEDLDRLQCLEQLTLKSTKIKRLPDSICMLKHLNLLNLRDCKLLEKLPDDLGRLECLEKLLLEECVVLLDIPNNICRMKSLKFFSLFYCNRVEELPEELGRLGCLEYLDIRGTRISNLPPSILSLQGLEIFRSEDKSPATTTTVAWCTVI